jgi:hemerythrin
MQQLHEVDYPSTSAHSGLHKDQISKLGEIEAKIEHGKLYQTELDEFINFWFVSHMAAIDTPMVVYVRRFVEQLKLPVDRQER